MTSMRVSHSGETILTPPQLPAYLSDTYDLKPIVGKPADEDIKAIHAVIRAADSVAHLPKFYNSDLSMQLSQHLFGAQMAVYRSNYSMSLLPGDKCIYTPPALPSHIPSTMREVIGTPSDEDIKSVQSVLRTFGHLAHTPHLYDADLNAKLSQHMFNLQFARYMHESSEGLYVSETEPEELLPVGSRLTQEVQSDPAIPHVVPDSQGEQRNVDPASEAEQVPSVPSELAQLGEAIVKAIKDATSETKEVLGNMNRMLTLIKRDQSTVGGMDKYYHVYKDPLNRQGVAASECGLPSLFYGYYQNGYKHKMCLDSNLIARYLKFFGVGADLIQGGEEPRLIDGRGREAEKLLLAQVGVLAYN